MSIIIAAGLLLGAAPPEAHRVAVDHRGQRVDVTYRSDLDIHHRQVGSAGAPGRPSTLRCTWKARVSVHREARSTAGHVLTRTIASDAPLSGTRPGWCAGQQKSIAADVAARSDRVRTHLLAVAEQDHDTLRAELDAAHGSARS